MAENFAKAYEIANCILDRRNGDPDADEAVLARQFNRLMERATRALLHPAENRPLLKELAAAIDPEGLAEGRYG